jgi:hypothetical protein
MRKELENTFRNKVLSSKEEKTQNNHKNMRRFEKKCNMWLEILYF